MLLQRLDIEEINALGGSKHFVCRMFTNAKPSDGLDDSCESRKRDKWIISAIKKSIALRFRFCSTVDQRSSADAVKIFRSTINRNCMYCKLASFGRWVAIENKMGNSGGKSSLVHLITFALFRHDTGERNGISSSGIVALSSFSRSRDHTK